MVNQKYLNTYLKISKWKFIPIINSYNLIYTIIFFSFLVY